MSRELAESFGMMESMTEILRRHCLRCIGHVAQMDDSRMLKQVLFRELVKSRPRHGTKRRWRDLAVADVQAIGVGRTWYKTAQNRKEWMQICKQCCASDSASDSEFCAANNSSPDHSYPCRCGCSFRRQGDLTWHNRFCDALTNQSTDKCFQVLSACVEEPFADKETSRDIHVFVALRDCPFVLWSLYPRLLPKDTTIINRWAAKG